MFKKPPSDLKTSSPLRSSERRKLRQRVIDSFELQKHSSASNSSADDVVKLGDLLVPEGLLIQKFSTHLGELGVAYLSPENDPLWFSIGKGSEDLIPTVYTLWKFPSLLPVISTPAAVVPKLTGGADLMIPGVIQHAEGLTPDQLVSINQYHPPIRPSDSSQPIKVRIGAPLAVGKMAVNSEVLSRAVQRFYHDDAEEIKGKAVHVLHTWKDHLWDLASTTSKRMDIPPPREVIIPPQTKTDLNEENSEPEHEGGEETGRLEFKELESVLDDEASNNLAHLEAPGNDIPSDPGPSTQHSDTALTAADIASCLRSALLQALSTTLSSLPPVAFPIQASVFWTTYVLPARPAQALNAEGQLVDSSNVDVKHSAYKSVKVFLKAVAKEGLVKLKETKGDVVITAVFPKHPAVVAHKPVRTVQSVETKREKAEERERKEKEAEEKRKGEVQVTELWKPMTGTTVPFFVSAEKDTSKLYTNQEIKEIFNAYVVTKQLTNPHDQQYINVANDDQLLLAVSAKNGDPPEFLKREEALSRVRGNMQSWHEVKIEGGEVVTKKGTAKSISIVVKVRQGRKAATLITGFESYFLNADDLADDLRKICASSTSVNAVAGGKPTDKEVLVQGKQIKLVTEYLMGKGVPKKWIESADLSADKKKK